MFWKNLDRRASDRVPSRRRIFRRTEPASRCVSTTAGARSPLGGGP